MIRKKDLGSRDSCPIRFSFDSDYKTDPYSFCGGLESVFFSTFFAP